MTQLRPVNTTYEPFSLEPEYIEANRGFVRRQDLSRVRRFLDLACGTGTVSEQLLAASPGAHLNGLDYDPVQIDLSTAHFRELGYEVRRGAEISDERAHGKPVLMFTVGSADDLPFPDASFDCVTIANAIHVVPDKEALLRHVQRVLRPGGVFGFNSAFYAGTYPPGTERHYYEWMKLATRWIEEQARSAEDPAPFRRVRGTTRKAFQNRWSSAAEWTAMLGGAGLRVTDTHERVVMLDERCFAAVGAYGGLAEVLLSGYVVETASMALQVTAKESLDVMGLTAIPRNWLELWAVKD